MTERKEAQIAANVSVISVPSVISVVILREVAL